MLKKFLLTAAIIAVTAPLAQAEPVKAWEGTLELPTYRVDAPEVAPIFECDWSYQRARRSVYPYTLDDNMTRERSIVAHKAIYVENEYIQICILPNIGGRLFYAIDKTNGYDIFYHQDCVKPANVGMLGQWISGGVEWNVFHHHRNTTALPVFYEITTGADGSKTVWVGETEWRHRMSWVVGMTIRPGKSYIEVVGKMMNTTPDDNSMLFWSNVSTGVDENYQIIFPQSTEFATFHCKESFSHWPITHEAYTHNEDYCNDIEADWWGKHPRCGNSMFIYDQKDDFVAGYDHGKHAGTVITGNHHILKGGKFWSWGPNSGWDTKILTENAGHYIELMTGAFSDNQPDYNWSAPGESKSFVEYMYGIRDMKGVKKANEKVSLNMDLAPQGALLLGVNATQKLSGMKVSVEKDGKALYNKTISVAPDKSFVETISIDPQIRYEELTMTLTDAEGRELLSYTPVVKDDSKPCPPAVERPLRPFEIANTEECYLVGLRALQFHNPFVQPNDYFEEVLRRDSGDTRANTKLGVDARKKGDWEKAKKHLRTAIARQTKDYTRPSDCEAMYNLGLVLKAEGKIAEALDTLYRATWTYTYNSPANYALAQIYTGLGDYTSAVTRLEEALDFNARNISAKNLLATVKRLQGKKAEALALTKEVLAFDPVNVYAKYEQKLLGEKTNLEKMVAWDPESWMELAVSYYNNGLADEAESILKQLNSHKTWATAKLWLGYLADKKGDKASAAKWIEEGLAQEIEYCNPFRLETVPVLEKAGEYAPENFKVPYYLGNLYYNLQPDKAMAYWAKTTQLNPSFALAYRNMGWANLKLYRDYQKSWELYQKAISLDATKPLYFEEADQAAENAGVAPATRYEFLKANHETCEKRYYPLCEEVMMGTFAGDYDRVLDLLHNCYFPTREGVANFHDVYVDALLLAGIDKCNKGLYEEAIVLFQECFEFPENHQVFYVDTTRPRDVQIYYYIAKAYEKMGDKATAKEYYQKATEVIVKKTEYRYWEAMSLKALGRKAEAKTLCKALIAEGKAAVVDHYVNFFGAEGTQGKTPATINTKAYYNQALGHLGLGHRIRAKRLFRKSLGLKVDNLWSMEMLREM